MAQVLIVGGDAATCLLLRSLCLDLGWSAQCAADLSTFIRLAATHPGNLLLIVATGGERGEGGDLLDRIAALRRVARLAPLLVVVRGADLPTRRRAFLLGAEDVVGWPADPRELAARLAAVLRVVRRDGDAQADRADGALRLVARPSGS